MTLTLNQLWSDSNSRDGSPREAPVAATIERRSVNTDRIVKLWPSESASSRINNRQQRPSRNSREEPSGCPQRAPHIARVRRYAFPKTTRSRCKWMLSSTPTAA